MTRLERIEQNAERLGYETNRVLLVLHLLWFFFVAPAAAHVAGMAAVLASLGLAYACENLRMWGSVRAEYAAGASAVASILAAFFWLYEVI